MTDYATKPGSLTFKAMGSAPRGVLWVRSGTSSPPSPGGQEV